MAKSRIDVSTINIMIGLLSDGYKPNEDDLETQTKAYMLSLKRLHHGSVLLKQNEGLKNLMLEVEHQIHLISENQDQLYANYSKTSHRLEDNDDETDVKTLLRNFKEVSEQGDQLLADYGKFRYFLSDAISQINALASRYKDESVLNFAKQFNQFKDFLDSIDMGKNSMIMKLQTINDLLGIMTEEDKIMDSMERGTE